MIDDANNYVVQWNPFRYRGYYYDQDFGLYYLNSRYYDPSTGRFINADEPETLFINGSAVMGVNLFAYCLNNPMKHIDPSGNSVILGILIGVIIGGVVGGITSALNGQNVLIGIAAGAFTGLLGSLTGGVLSGIILGSIGAVGGNLINQIGNNLVLGNNWNDIDKTSVAISAMVGAVLGAFNGLSNGIIKKISNKVEQSTNVLIQNALKERVKLGLKPLFVQPMKRAFYASIKAYAGISFAWNTTLGIFSSLMGV